MNTPRLRWEMWGMRSYRAIVYDDAVYCVVETLDGKAFCADFAGSVLGRTATVLAAKALAQAHFDALCGAIEKMKEDK